MIQKNHNWYNQQLQLQLEQKISNQTVYNVDVQWRQQTPFFAVAMAAPPFGPHWLIESAGKSPQTGI